MAELLAKKEFINYDLYNQNMRPLTDSIKHNNLNGFRFFLLNQSIDCHSTASNQNTTWFGDSVPFKSLPKG